MSNLYTVKEMAEILNEEYGDNPASYEFTEERIRARLRSARAKGTITPKYMGYDRRTNYYSEEDFNKLKATWIGPELPEFSEYPEDLKIIEETREEVVVRITKPVDAEAIFDLLPTLDSPNEAESMRNYITKMLKSRDVVNFVSTQNEEIITGWAQAEISAGISIIQGTITGTIRVYVPPTRYDKTIAVRSLIYRAERWIQRFDVNRIYVELPESMADLTEMLTDSMSYHEHRLLIFQKDMNTIKQ